MKFFAHSTQRSDDPLYMGHPYGTLYAGVTLGIVALALTWFVCYYI